MRSSYKKLGQFIKQVSIKNTNLKVTKLLGVSITKKFIPSIANTIGTDMSKYKIVKKNQFTYGSVTSRNGDKISVALLEDDEAIVSTSYTVFEVTDREKLLPEYLMMWFRREEFDRYARFMSHGSTRESFGWDEMCEVKLPIPSLEKQREIVREYETITDRIKLNEELNKKLEETAQSIYKEWFVNFEFPDENGKPYKSNGGEMEYSDELDMEIPKGWKGTTSENVMNFTTGKLNSNAAIDNGNFPFFTCSAETFKTNTYSFQCEAVLLAGNNASAIYPLKFYRGKFDAYQRTYVITTNHNQLSNEQIYLVVKSELENFKGLSSGTATKFLTMQILNNLPIVLANEYIAEKFYKLLKPIFDHKLTLQHEIEFLVEFDTTLLSKMATIEG
ncbi:MAG: restriction endonuclease subunit S [Sulfurimonas sp.]|uniref:restriction endonuclease subunit S n=1 Tax=Sulfurimonas sp. TaxID=2022749 RepID=UPI0025D445B7|nr:restriction endonuclease subunit S [Sulfurimonas sp.]MCK9491326.1 restriction endonuclease subunit S [Sulfurimonas sp.]